MNPHKLDQREIKMALVRFGHHGEDFISVHWAQQLLFGPTFLGTVLHYGHAAWEDFLDLLYKPIWWWEDRFAKDDAGYTGELLVAPSGLDDLLADNNTMKYHPELMMELRTYGIDGVDRLDPEDIIQRLNTQLEPR